jgi:hypothetical protein
MRMEIGMPPSSFGSCRRCQVAPEHTCVSEDNYYLNNRASGCLVVCLGQALENANGAKLALWNPALGTIYLALLFVVGIGDMSSIAHQHLSKASMLMPPNSRYDHGFTSEESLFEAGLWVSA